MKRMYVLIAFATAFVGCATPKGVAPTNVGALRPPATVGPRATVSMMSDGSIAFPILGVAVRPMGWSYRPNPKADIPKDEPALILSDGLAVITFRFLTGTTAEAVIAEGKAHIARQLPNDEIHPVTGEFGGAAGFTVMTRREHLYREWRITSIVVPMEGKPGTLIAAVATSPLEFHPDVINHLEMVMKNIKPF